MNRARIREIAEEGYGAAKRYSCLGQHRAATIQIESAILRAIEELLEREPSEEVLEAGGKFLHIMSMPKQEASSIYRAMYAQLLKEVKGE